MADLGTAVGMVAPYYNLALALIAFVLFLKLFKFEDKKFAYIKPWKLLFTGFMLFIIEEVMTVLRALGQISFDPAIFPLFEMVIVTLFIYILLLQKQYVKSGKKE